MKYHRTNKKNFSSGKKSISCDFEGKGYPLCTSAFPSWKMEQEHREILRNRRIDIATDLEPLKLLNRLDVLDDDDREEIKTKETRREQAYALLDMLIRKGPNAFKNFVSTLYELKSQKHLADLLIQDSGIQIASIPKGENTFFSNLEKVWGLLVLL